MQRLSYSSIDTAEAVEEKHLSTVTTLEIESSADQLDAREWRCRRIVLDPFP